MPYTDNPAGDPTDQVRFLVGDTDTAHQELTDNQVGFLLSEEGSPIRAAARAAEVLAAKYTKAFEEKQVGPLRLRSFKGRAVQYMALARRLWSRASVLSGGPYAGGISLVDKASNVADTDRVRPAFGRRMQEYPQGAPNESTSEELLS